MPQVYGGSNFFTAKVMNKISIVTVVFNDQKHIVETIESVIQQTYNNYEYIIIDGGSTDGTLEAIKKYGNSIFRIKSEPDNGIYDAMNKGIKIASGSHIIFMNSGDKFWNNEVLENIFGKFEYDNKSIIYGTTICNYNSIKIFQPLIPFWENKKYCPSIGICHQSIFVPLDFAKSNPFNLQFQVCADYDMIRKLYDNSYRFYDSEIVIAEVRSGEGFSDIHFKRKLIEKAEICKIKDTLKFKLYYSFQLIKKEVKDKLRLLEPQAIRKYRFLKTKKIIK